jgi:hypothetical protein
VVVVGSEGRRGKGCDAALPSFLSLQVAMKHVYMYIYVETERGSVSVMSERRKDYKSWSGISAGGGEGACMLSIGRNSMQHEQTHHTREREMDWSGEELSRAALPVASICLYINQGFYQNMK